MLAEAAAPVRAGETRDGLLLFIGHSHIEAIRAALSAEPRPGIVVMNLRQVQIADLFLKDLRPNAVCLCIAGNLHNLLGLFEHPRPFSVGCAETGAAPEHPARAFIPYQVVHDTIAYALREAFASAEEIFDRYDDAIRLVLNAPPPVGDEDHIRSHPGVFSDKLDLALGHPDLRLALYRAQTDVFRKMAKSQGATFVEPDRSVVDPRGFLSGDYCASDPTHANRRYGDIMLRKVAGLVERAQ